MKMLIDKLVKDWAWRTNDGMPDPSKKDHLELLEQTLRANKYSEDFIKKFMAEIEFSDKKDFLKYKSKHKMRPTTKVTIGGKDTTAGEADPESKGEGGFDEKLQKKANKMKDKISSASEQVAFNSEEDESNFNSGMEKLFSGGKPSESEMEAVNKYANISDSPGGLKIYLANKEAGNFKQGARTKAFDAKGKDALAIRKSLTDNGMEVTSAVTGKEGSEPPKIKGKQLTAGKMAAGPPVKAKITTTKDESGNIESVTIGNRTMKKLPVPDKKQLAELSMKLEQLQKQNPDVPKDEIESQADRTVRAINRRNKMIDKYAESKEIEFVNTVEGADSSTKEGRDRITKEYPKSIANSMKELVGDNPTKAEKEVIDRVEKLGEIENSDEYEKEAMAILAKMNKVDSIRKGAADLTESMVYLSLNKKGIQTELPAGETVKVSDIVSFSDDSEIDSKSPDYLKQVASKGVEYVVTMEREGGVSVKMDGGAASGAKAKMEITEFKNKDTKQKALDLVENHNNFLGTKKDPTTSETIARGKEKLDETENWAKENGLIQEDFEPKIGNRTTRQWSEDTVKLWESKGQNFGSEEEKEAVIEGLNQYARQGVLLQEIHNNDIQEQPYGNINVKLGKEDGNMEITDGITTASLMRFQANPGFGFIKTKEGRTIPRPNAVYAGNLIHSEYNHETQKFEATH